EPGLVVRVPFAAECRVGDRLAHVPREGVRIPFVHLRGGGRVDDEPGPPDVDQYPEEVLPTLAREDPQPPLSLPHGAKLAASGTRSAHHLDVEGPEELGNVR